MSSPGPSLAGVAHLMGDPARANILSALMDGRALTAKELAYVAGVAPQTASGHLAQLLQGGLLGLAVQGRHRYYRLAGPEVAAALEGLMVLAGPPRHPASRVSVDLREARTCYDHFAGRLGTDIHGGLVEGGHLRVDLDGYGLTASGESVFAAWGIDPAARKGRRSALRPCLDWSERRPHLAGSLAAALVCRCLEAGWVRRIKDSRAVTLTPSGREVLARVLPRFACEEPEEARPGVRAPATADA